MKDLSPSNKWDTGETHLFSFDSITLARSGREMKNTLKFWLENCATMIIF